MRAERLAVLVRAGDQTASVTEAVQLFGSVTSGFPTLVVGVRNFVRNAVDNSELVSGYFSMIVAE
jgi:hypothetical protein